MMEIMAILKKVKALYGRVLDRNKCQVALQVVERPAKDTSLFERKHPLCQHPSKVIHVAVISGPQYNGFMGGGLGKLDPELEHPPPAHA